MFNAAYKFLHINRTLTLQDIEAEAYLVTLNCGLRDNLASVSDASDHAYQYLAEPTISRQLYALNLPALATRKELLA